MCFCVCMCLLVSLYVSVSVSDCVNVLVSAGMREYISTGVCDSE